MREGKSLFNKNKFKIVFCTFVVSIVSKKVNQNLFSQVKPSKNLPSIPILCASLLGLFHGVGFNLMLTISFFNGDWVGNMTWCGVTAVLHPYVVYCMIYCFVVVSLEV